MSGRTQRHGAAGGGCSGSEAPALHLAPLSRCLHSSTNNWNIFTTSSLQVCCRAPWACQSSCRALQRGSVARQWKIVTSMGSKTALPMQPPWVSAAAPVVPVGSRRLLLDALQHFEGNVPYLSGVSLCRACHQPTSRVSASGCRAGQEQRVDAAACRRQTSRQPSATTSGTERWTCWSGGRAMAHSGELPWPS